jgi:hypothetical protein
MAILIPLKRKYLYSQFKGLQRKKGDNQPGKSFRDPQKKFHVVPRQPGKSGDRALTPPGTPNGLHDTKRPQDCRCGGCNAKRK